MTATLRSGPAPQTAGWRRGAPLAVAAALVLAMLGGCGPTPIAASTGPDGAPGPTLIGFAAPRTAHAAALRAFGDTPAGAGATWATSYGASGEQSRSVQSGLNATVVHLSLEDDVTRLVDAGLVAPEWNAGSDRGLVSTSVIVLVVRSGNPKNITGWPDLVRNDVNVVTPNPASSGSARWNVLAAYGSVLAQGGTPEQAEDYLAGFFSRVAALPGSSRDATTAFTSGTGDVLVSYENEAIVARHNGVDIDYLVPSDTLLVENPGAVLVGAPPVGQAYLDFLRSTPGQVIFAEQGFRPLRDVGAVVVDGATDPTNPFPVPTNLLTIDEDFGGWAEVNAKFFGDTGIITTIQRAANTTAAAS